MNPFTENPATAVAALGEAALLRAIRGWLGDVALPAPEGMGDDCACLKTPAGGMLLATTDGVIYGRHFDDTCTPAAIGAKLLKRNISDIAAMGGAPDAALLNLILAREVATAWLEGFYDGLAQSCREYGVKLVGGDIAQGPAKFFAAHLTLLGVPVAEPVTRAGAQIGDWIYVTGELGGSLLGKHLDFTPRLREGQWLARRRAARAMIDVTDGLAKDLPDILPEGADALLETAVLPIASAAEAQAGRDGRGAVAHALTDGEDYELLFALNPAWTPLEFEAEWSQVFTTPVHRIGRMTPAHDAARPKQLRDAQTLAPLLSPGAHGYEHLR